MAGDWIKVEKLTPDKPEIAILARKLGVSIGDAFLNWFRVYTWADGVTCPGFVPHLSPTDVDMLSRAIPGTCEALASTEIGWMVNRSDGVEFANWDRHNGKSAKQRALESEKKRKQRGKAGGDVPNMSLDCPATNGTKTGTRQEETRGEFQLSKGNRKSNGKPPVHLGVGDDRLSPLPPLPVDAGEDRAEEEPFDLSSVDWDRVTEMAEAAAKRVRPINEVNRRQWLKFGVLAEMAFSESWLMDAAEAVIHAKETKRTPQAHFMAVLQCKAAEQHSCDRATFVSMLRRIEIPTKVWKSGVLEIRQ